MSYCRWSSDDYQCDLYVYEAHVGFVIHVAKRRHDLTGIELPAPINFGMDDPTWAQRYVARHIEVSRRLKDAMLVNINLAHDGETFTAETPGECADKVAELLALGYRCPPGVVELLRGEQADLDAAQEHQS